MNNYEYEKKKNGIKWYAEMKENNSQEQERVMKAHSQEKR